MVYQLAEKANMVVSTGVAHPIRQLRKSALNRLAKNCDLRRIWVHANRSQLATTAHKYATADIWLVLLDQ